MRSSLLRLSLFFLRRWRLDPTLPLRPMWLPGRSSHLKSEATGLSNRLPVPKCLPFATASGCTIPSTHLSCQSSQPRVSNFGVRGPLTLLRRVTLDLTGLPPTPEEAAAFLKDPSPNAYERVVDRLLASPALRRALGRHWLDVARYADSDGFKADATRPNIWRYRDYVIKSFNDDKPYDRFVREQIAGDELYPGDPDALVATGFNRHWIDETNAARPGAAAVRRRSTTSPTSTGVDVPRPDRSAAPAATTTSSIRSCTSDYYRLQAFFANTSFGDGPLPLADRAEQKAYDEQKAVWEEKTKGHPRRDGDDSRAAAQEQGRGRHQDVRGRSAGSDPAGAVEARHLPADDVPHGLAAHRASTRSRTHARCAR